MAASSGSLHEPADQLPPELVDRHRAIVSIMEELEAVDWYDQRVAAASDPELAAILAHNRDEEKEHAAMTLEWLRRHDPALDAQLRAYLFSSGPILEVEERAAAGGGDNDGGAGGGGAGGSGDGSLGIGRLTAHPDVDDAPEGGKR
ncbi:MAG: ferritin-like domain-containing protein [Actinomycetota bacterium]|nr:ferritin-like domain-containing protein [Actinomycetota bacterium]